MNAISEFLGESTDEIIGMMVVIPAMGVLSYLTLMGTINPSIILAPVSMILVHYFRKSEIKK